MSRRRLLVAVAVAVVSLGLLRATVSQSTSARAASQSTEVAKDPAAWRRSMQKLPLPGRGCFKAAFPRIKWNQVRCAARRRPKPMAPSHGHRPFTVGHGNNYSAEVTGTMTEAEGSFDSVTGVTSETGALSQHSTTQYPDVYSLQLNAKPFPTPACNGGGGGCIGWQQFVYASADQQLLIQYWLEFYGPTCPNGWYSDGFDDCYTDGPNIATVAQEPVSQLMNLRLDGKASASGNDTVMLFIGSNQVTAANMGNMLDLGSAWTGAEFAVVGDCCDTEANFNAGATIVTRTKVLNGTMNAPTCVLDGWTYETNNLDLGPRWCREVRRPRSWPPKATREIRPRRRARPGPEWATRISPPSRGCFTTFRPAAISPWRRPLRTSPCRRDRCRERPRGRTRR
jgi:hypothetical protein